MQYLNCTQCQAPQPVEAHETFVACTTCYAYHKVDAGQLTFVSQFKAAQKPVYVCFEVGQQLTLNGGQYTITGITQRHDATNKTIKWREYFLKNEINDAAYLNEYNGQWLLVKPLYNTNLEAEWRFVERDGIRYGLFQEYFQKLIWASGRFDYDIADLDKLYSQEYIAPPQMLIKEYRKTDVEQDIEWYEGECVDENEVHRQFLDSGKQLLFPPKTGIGPTEVYKSKFYSGDAITISSVAWGVLLLIQFVFLITSPTKTVFQDSYSMTDMTYDTLKTYANTPVPIVSKSFTVEKNSKFEIELSSSVDNSWLEADVTMVNEVTKDELPIVIGNEYYHGIESGESWTEGATTASLDYSSVPAGQYHLLIESTTPNKTGSYTITLKSGGVYWSNLLILMLLIACVPIFLYYKEKGFEIERWSDSDFSPYATDD